MSVCLMFGGGPTTVAKTKPTHKPNPPPPNNKNSYQNYEKKVPLQEDSIFRVFSQSKPISTAAFLTLVDEVRLASSDGCYIEEDEAGGMMRGLTDS